MTLEFYHRFFLSKQCFSSSHQRSHVSKTAENKGLVDKWTLEKQNRERELTFCGEKKKKKVLMIVKVWFLAPRARPVEKRGVWFISAFGPEWVSPPAPLHCDLSAQTNVTKCQTFLSSRHKSHNSTQQPSTKPRHRGLSGEKDLYNTSHCTSLI